MIHNHFLGITGRAPASSGLRYRNSFHSYPQLAERIAGLAAGLQGRGIGEGSVVAILVPNSPDLFVIVHALFAIGAIALPLSTAATTEECLWAVRKARAGTLIVRPELAGLAARVADMAGGPDALAVLTSGGVEDDASIARLERSTPGALPELGGDAPALYMLSSGSTGLPKIVPHTHAELLADARRTSGAWRLQPDDVVFNMLPGNFAMGLLLGAMDAAEVGATIVYWNDARPLMLARGALAEAIASERVTVMGAVPAMYGTLAGIGGDVRFDAMRLAFSGGAALTRPIFDAMRERFGVTLRQSYGSTESIMFSHNDADDPENNWESVGRPAGDGEARLIPMDTVLGDEVGELIVRSSSVMQGYLGDDDATRATFIDGWLRTGDLARIDAAGQITIVGRTKLLIEVSGYKIDPLEVEAALVTHPAVAEAVVVGYRPSPQADQRLKAFVVRRADVSEDAILAFLRSRLSVQKVPTLVEFIDEMPKSSAGKILRGKLAEMA